MRGILTTHKGMEELAAMEVKELIGKESDIGVEHILFGIGAYEELFELCYRSQSAVGIYALIFKFDYSSYDGLIENFKNSLEKARLEEWLGKSMKFRVNCIKNFETTLSTPEIEKKFGDLIIAQMQHYDQKQKVDLKNPDIIIAVLLSEKSCFLGIDFVGFDLSKRPYKLFTHAASVKGTIAYFLVRASGYKKNETLIDCFSTSGTMPIEAALYSSNFPVNFYSKEKFLFLKLSNFKNFAFKEFYGKMDKKISPSNLNIYNTSSSMNFINNAKRNSKLAGVEKWINFSRIDVEWLDTKFKKSSVDRIVTKLPCSKKQDNEKLYNEFFYQAEYILKKKGRIALIGNNDIILKCAGKYKFKVEEKKAVFSGQEEHTAFVLVK
jgi:23S rRNA G2445 N2-methylase RlmL